MKDLLKLLRVHQWFKNLFVFIPVIFSGNLFIHNLFFQSVLAFFLFSIAASSIYIINDYSDIESDKNHPTKRFRPLASGAISKTQAIILLFLLVSIEIVLLILFANLTTSFLVLGYFLLNLFYTFKLKTIAILDVMVIAMGFVLRVLVGGSMTGIEISDWTILLTFVLALMLALGKRRGEIVNDQTMGVTRKSLEGYNLEFINIALVINSVMVIVCYMMFTLSEDTQERFHSLIFYTIIFVIIGVFRYLQQTFVFNRTESPTKLIYKDLFLQLTIVGWILTIVMLIYFN
ncbi:UbiA prenyltransferase family protein [Moheibacter stercoris]|uniref:4-hydroxybenzoate polyprenyltransferase n=1 Tax=Moheibacter stercoris TaxID=1628251 RepID=A0ABV2LSH5_9FLAO